MADTVNLIHTKYGVNALKFLEGKNVTRKNTEEGIIYFSIKLPEKMNKE